MECVNIYKIRPKDIEKIELYLKNKGLFLQEISEAVNGFTIAHVSLIEKVEDIEEQTEFNIVINLTKCLCCKFSFYGHRTDGLRIYSHPKTGKLEIFNPAFHISFVKTISGNMTPYILITYLDFVYDSMYDDGNYEGRIFASIIDFSTSENYNNCASFKFDDCLHYDNSVKVYQIDNEGYAGLFAYKLISKSGYDDLYSENEYEYIDQLAFDGIWNKTVWCANERIIPLSGKSFFDKANEIMDKIRNEQRKYEEDCNGYYDFDYYD